MGDAFAAKLDLDALVDIMLRGSIEALDADTGCLRLGGPEPRLLPEDAPEDLRRALDAAAEAATASGAPEQLDARRRLGARAALPRRRARRPATARSASRAASAPFQDDEVALLTELVAKAHARRPTSSAITPCASRRSPTR